MFESKVKEILTITAILVLLGGASCSKLCNSGYEGSKCNVLITTEFLGHWSAVDSPGNIIYVDTINTGAALNDISFSTAFAGHHFNHTIQASVDNSDITIPYQQPDTGGNFVQGTGVISNDNNHISLNYQIISGTDTAQIISNYTGTWTRQN